MAEGGETKAGEVQQYKWLRPDHSGAYGHGDYSGYLPKGARPGKWLPKVADPESRVRGYHTVDVAHLTSHWCDDGILFEVECRGACEKDGDKSAWETIRLRRRVGQLTHPLLRGLACDFAERMLPIYQASYPGDTRLRLAIDTARRFAAGNATRPELDAAWDAARDAAREWQGNRVLAVLEEGE